GHHRASRFPEVLRASHAEFSATTPIPSDLTIDAIGLSADEVASIISAVLGAPPPSADADSYVRPLFGDIDCLQIPVPELDSALAFYRDALAHRLLWRTTSQAGLQLANSGAELVLQTERAELEANLSVASADDAAQHVAEAGGVIVVPPF